MTDKPDPIAVIREVLEFYRRQENTQTANLALAALDQLEANQALIAELVEALETIERRIASISLNAASAYPPNKIIPNVLSEMLNDIRAALAKAKGER